MTGRPPVYVPIDSTFPFLKADTLLKEAIAAQNAMIEEINHHLEFDDLDAVSDCIDENVEKLRRFSEKVNFSRENRADILDGFKPKNRWPKFRRYANNKRTFKRLREVEIWKSDNVRFSHN